MWSLADVGNDCNQTCEINGRRCIDGNGAGLVTGYNFEDMNSIGYIAEILVVVYFLFP